MWQRSNTTATATTIEGLAYVLVWLAPVWLVLAWLFWPLFSLEVVGGMVYGSPRFQGWEEVFVLKTLPN